MHIHDFPEYVKVRSDKQYVKIYWFCKRTKKNVDTENMNEVNIIETNRNKKYQKKKKKSMQQEAVILVDRNPRGAWF